MALRYANLMASIFPFSNLQAHKTPASFIKTLKSLPPLPVLAAKVADDIRTKLRETPVQSKPTYTISSFHPIRRAIL